MLIFLLSCDGYKNYDRYWKLPLNSEGLGWNSKYFYSENQPTKFGDYWHYDSKGNPIRWYDEHGNIIKSN